MKKAVSADIHKTVDVSFLLWVSHGQNSCVMFLIGILCLLKGIMCCTHLPNVNKAACELTSSRVIGWSLTPFGSQV